MSAAVRQVLSSVARRQQICAWARRSALVLLVLAAALALHLCASRLLGLWSQPLPWWSLLCALPVAGLVGWIGLGRPGLHQAARLTDDRLGSEELFLTSLQERTQEGSYAPLVQEAASSEAARVDPARVQPYSWSPLATKATVIWALVLPLFLLPQMDPFGQEQERERIAQMTAELRKEKQRVATRKKLLAKKKVDKPRSPEVDEALDKLVHAFQKMRTNNPKQNEHRLRQQQKGLSKAWRDAKDRVGAARKISNAGQRIGMRVDPKKEASWSKQLAEGKTEGLQQELQELQALAKELAEALQDDTPQGQERKRQAQEEIKRRIQELQDFLRDHGQSKELDKALSKALDQLQAMKDPKLAKEAQQALQQTMELSAMEMKNLAQSLKDMKALEKALKTLEKAMQANKKRGNCKSCKGGGCKDCQGSGKQPGQGKGKGQGKGEQPGAEQSEKDALEALAEYERMFQEMLENGEQEGPGMGGPGRGKGGQAPENNGQNNKYKSKKSKSALSAGRMLMELKTREVGDKGEVKARFAEEVRKVHDAVEEAIRAEEVPPGYHEGIKRYFDNLRKESEKVGGKMPSKKK